MKTYPACCKSMYCGEIYCRGCENEKFLIEFKGKEAHEKQQLVSAFTLAREVNNALERDEYKTDAYYQHLAGRFVHYYTCGHRFIARDKDMFYQHQCAECQSERPAH